MAKEARKSLLLSDARIEVIPNGLDPETFRLRDTEGISSAMEIPEDHRVILFLASSTRQRRKGFDLLDEALSELRAERTTLVSIGGESPEFHAPQPHVHLGSMKSDLLLSVFYSLADVFVIPSRQDNLPNTVLESMACGTPVVGFKTGGIPDMVRPGETGWLAEGEDVRELRNALESALEDDAERRRRGKRCRTVVENEYTLDVQAAGYEKLYGDLLRRQENY
ncbi:glycosyltransferase involved in cell wall biosynthesis [Salinibacter ruber]|uniref:Glycosyltransferase involved in cell wall biosynthesis n=2 Tax=Salinibacter ruber TaxID=146919 RepID=A0A9X2Z5B2_9BACT|nr:glycosyltransferase involved in cell wall biosynthesis [Salinibacter ruber]